MGASSVFFATERRLRAPWRILIFVLAAITLFVVAESLVNAIAAFGGAAMRGLALYTWVPAIALLGATWVSLRWIDHEAWSYVKLDARAARPELLASGALMGAVAIGIPCVLLLVARELIVVPAVAGSWGGAAFSAALLLLPAALFEELAIRGYLFSVLREALGWRGALIGTSVVFGAIHANNPGASAQPVLVVTIAGFFLGAIVLVTDSLYAAWMAHFAWNWTLAGAVHTSVSGLGIATPDYKVIDNGPDWLTGGAWGPEASVVAALAMFVFLFYLFARHMRRLGAQPSAHGTHG